MALSGEDASLKKLLENASSVLTACQNTSTTHQPKNGARHSKKHIKTVSKESKGAKKQRPISTNGLAMAWTDEEEEEATCDVCGGHSSSSSVVVVVV
ncbi:hypothetical protein LSAT2_005117 [Lamellibrachia satsuma]|nr:hypothetical protein LSAT2_005117 [Lamellibrachia satsuma]